MLEGDALAVLRIPRIGLDTVVVEGTSEYDLKRGPGHYIQTAYPWDAHGRTAIAGHRTTYGAPFWAVDELEIGDAIELHTERGLFTYRVAGSEVVADDDVRPLEQTAEPSLVLTTCTPRFSATQRLIVTAERNTPPAPTAAFSNRRK